MSRPAFLSPQFLPRPPPPSHLRPPTLASLPPTSRRRRRPPDPLLSERARTCHKLHATRKRLRKTQGTEPSIQEAIRHYANTHPSCPPTPSEWRVALAARNELTVKWLWLVAAVARKAHRTYVACFPEACAVLSLSDIVQEGVCGLISSVETWDSSRGVAFDAFAFYAIKRAILRALENQSRPIRLPVHVLNKLSKMRRVRESVESTEGTPSVDDIARMAGVDCKEAKLYLERSRGVWSIDAPIRKTEGLVGSTTLREFLIDHSVDVARQVERACTKEAVAELVMESELEELERSVLWLKYGLGDGVERVRAEVSRILKVRVEKVRRAELSALNKLRDTMAHDSSVWTELIS